MNKTFLFSVDLEDVRLTAPNGLAYTDRVVENTQFYLEWLQKHQLKTTFFVVGNIARNYPKLIASIVDQGHEIACHTNEHIPLDQHTAKSFYMDIKNNLEALYNAGATEIKGFRAPTFSLTKETAWAYEVLTTLGFTYSSSVLPAPNPLYGWPEFKSAPKRINDQLIEIPMTVQKLGPTTIPFSGGIYFRLLPQFVLTYLFKQQQKQNLPILGYFHPYDIDLKQEKFMHGGINNNRFYNWLMFQNRHTVFKKLDALITKGYSIIPYRNYLESIAHEL